RPHRDTATHRPTGDDPKRGWAIAPQFHRSHWAIFETEKPIGDADGITLTFTLSQQFGKGRTIGRLRLSALTGKAEGTSLPAEVAKALQTPAEKRSDAQKKALRDY